MTRRVLIILAALLVAAPAAHADGIDPGLLAKRVLRAEAHVIRHNVAATQHHRVAYIRAACRSYDAAPALASCKLVAKASNGRVLLRIRLRAYVDDYHRPRIYEDYSGWVRWHKAPGPRGRRRSVYVYVPDDGLRIPAIRRVAA